MTPRPVGCDGYDCQPASAGWTHTPGCATQGHRPVVHLNRETGEDYRDATDMEDGYYGRQPVQQRRGAGIAAVAA